LLPQLEQVETRSKAHVFVSETETRGKLVLTSAVISDRRAGRGGWDTLGSAGRRVGQRAGDAQQPLQGQALSARDETRCGWGALDAFVAVNGGSGATGLALLQSQPCSSPALRPPSAQAARYGAWESL